MAAVPPGVDRRNRVLARAPVDAPYILQNDTLYNDKRHNDKVRVYRFRYESEMNNILSSHIHKFLYNNKPLACHLNDLKITAERKSGLPDMTQVLTGDFALHAYFEEFKQVISASATAQADAAKITAYIPNIDSLEYSSEYTRRLANLDDIVIVMARNLIHAIENSDPVLFSTLTNYITSTTLNSLNLPREQREHLTKFMEYEFDLMMDYEHSKLRPGVVMPPNTYPPIDVHANFGVPPGRPDEFYENINTPVFFYTDTLTNQLALPQKQNLLIKVLSNKTTCGAVVRRFTDVQICMPVSISSYTFRVPIIRFYINKDSTGSYNIIMNEKIGLCEKTAIAHLTYGPMYSLSDIIQSMIENLFKHHFYPWDSATHEADIIKLLKSIVLHDLHYIDVPAIRENMKFMRDTFQKIINEANSNSFNLRAFIVNGYLAANRLWRGLSLLGDVANSIVYLLLKLLYSHHFLNRLEKHRVVTTVNFIRSRTKCPKNGILVGKWHAHNMDKYVEFVNKILAVDLV